MTVLLKIKNSKAILFLMAAAILGSILRLENKSDYKFYPDSYQILVGAENIKNFGGVIGKLGADGMSYPDFFQWTRPILPVLINVFRFTSQDTATLALSIGILASIGGIFFAFWYAKNLFHSVFAGLIAAILMAISFNHTVWSGFIFTESVAISLQLILWALIYAQQDRELGDWRDLAIGTCFGLSVLARFEYIALVIPMVFLVFSARNRAWLGLLNIFAGFLFTISLAIFLLGPLPYNWIGLFGSMASLWLPIGVLGVLILLGTTEKAKNFFKKNNTYSTLAVLVIVCLATISVFVPGLRAFWQTDFVLAAMFFMGLLILAFDPGRRTIFVSIILGSVSLGAVYYSINPLIQRYWTHLLPFMVIPGVVCVEYLLQKKNIFLVVVPVLLITQIFYTWTGVKRWDHGVWFEKSYEEVSARQLKNKINETDLLLVSFPEPYFYFTGNSTYSLVNSKPYFYIPEYLDTRNIVIVADEGMRDLFGEFYGQVEEKLSAFKYDEYYTGAKYRYITRIEDEKQPVSLYRLPLSELRNITANETNSPNSLLQRRKNLALGGQFDTPKNSRSRSSGNNDYR